jgi:deoxyribose-phosphate aldolase
MLRELIISDKNTSQEDLLKYFGASSNYLVDRLCMPAGLIPQLHPYVDDFSYISSLIDFPYGWSSSKNRVSEIISAYHMGIKTMDFVLSPYHITNFNVLKIQKELETLSNLKKEYSIELRPILEYRLFDVVNCISVGEILMNFGFKTIVVSTGTMVDDKNDNMLVSLELSDIGLDVITCSRLMSKTFMSDLDSIEVYGVRFCSIFAAETALGQLTTQ